MSGGRQVMRRMYVRDGGLYTLSGAQAGMPLGGGLLTKLARSFPFSLRVGRHRDLASSFETAA
ncbi:hypothetical protein BD311DRAFT_133811 [Dichomitus squalens]|uniref:Uncharacterized protein n=1 Tax=Dichomitus squalens TaxID=114155 RepID=A0A4V2K138_9APHY|nr:hypothetical protein BD311DRAFT_133811 [Dichomitus squalens]